MSNNNSATDDERDVEQTEKRTIHQVEDIEKLSDTDEDEDDDDE